MCIAIEDWLCVFTANGTQPQGFGWCSIHSCFAVCLLHVIYLHQGSLDLAQCARQNSGMHIHVIIPTGWHLCAASTRHTQAQILSLG